MKTSENNVRSASFGKEDLIHTQHSMMMQTHSTAQRGGACGCATCVLRSASESKRDAEPPRCEKKKSNGVRAHTGQSLEAVARRIGPTCASSSSMDRHRHLPSYVS
mmetsp:Transcript_6829/g.13550  ORF Transcript_6829/g.13550 Transcript_6829/m.13550 type:complete len:106 (-) Transcript_6829:10-327(-)